MRAAIDLGSNSVLLVVVEDDGRVLHDEARVVGLGKGLGDGGRFSPDRMQAASQALSDYARTATELGVPAGEVRAVSTSSARRATNADEFFAGVERDTGLQFRVISGDEEARLMWVGALSSLELPDGQVMVVDLGGGSTELAIGQTSLGWRHSFEVGSVRLTERVLGPEVARATEAHLQEMRDRVAEVFSAAPIPSGVERVVGVAGSVTTLVAAQLGLTTYDGARVHGATLTDAALAGFQQRLIGLDAPGRRAVFEVSPERADYLLAGATVLREALARVGASEMTVSDRGLRYGLVGEAP